MSSSDSGPATLRDQLRAALPRIPLKAAWRDLVRHNRGRRDEGPRILGQRDVDRALIATPPDTFEVGALKAALAACDGAAVDRSLDWLPRVATEPVDVSITGWPQGFGPELQERLLRRPLGAMSPGEAAAVRREFDDLILGGSTLAVQVDLPDGHILPGVPRHLRSQPPRRDRTGPWLPHVDESGKRYLTPRAMAERQAGYVASVGSSVLDAYCGLGGNAIACAMAGLRVVAVEADPKRLGLARRNAKAFGVDIDFRKGDGRDHLMEDVDVVFLDPPWNRGAPTWSSLFGYPLPDKAAVLKLPRTFDLATLPDGDWDVRWEFGAGEDDSSIVRMISAIRR